MRDKMITSYIFNQYYRYTAGSNAIDIGPVSAADAAAGLFINPTEVIWSNTNAVVVACHNANSIAFYNNAGTTNTTVAPIVRGITLSSTANPGQRISYIKQSNNPNTPNVVYVGTTGGRVYKVTYSTSDFTISSSVYLNTGALPIGYVSSIDVRGATDNEMVVTFSNYGLESVWYCANINASPTTSISWISLDAIANSLPDVPVWSAIFAPANNTAGYALVVGTEVGVYTTLSLQGGGNSLWTRSAESPMTRVSQLKIRPSDKMMLASTYGRGLWRSDMFSPQQIWMGAISNTENCSPTFTDYSNPAFTSRTWYNNNGNQIGTGINVVLNCPSIYDWLELRGTTAAGVVIKLRRRVGEMANLPSSTLCLCSPFLTQDEPSSESSTVSALKKGQMIISPNPNNGNTLRINLQQVSLTNVEQTTNTQSIFSLYDLNGKLVLVQDIEGLDVEIPLPSHLENGLYIAEINLNGERYREKLIIAK